MSKGFEIKAEDEDRVHLDLVSIEGKELEKAMALMTSFSNSYPITDDENKFPSVRKKIDKKLQDEIDEIGGEVVESWYCFPASNRFTCYFVVKDREGIYNLYGVFNRRQYTGIMVEELRLKKVFINSFKEME